MVFFAQGSVAGAPTASIKILKRKLNIFTGGYQDKDQDSKRRNIKFCLTQQGLLGLVFLILWC